MPNKDIKSTGDKLAGKGLFPKTLSFPPSPGIGVIAYSTLIFSI